MRPFMGSRGTGALALPSRAQPGSFLRPQQLSIRYPIGFTTALHTNPLTPGSRRALHGNCQNDKRLKMFSGICCTAPMM